METRRQLQDGNKATKITAEGKRRQNETIKQEGVKQNETEMVELEKEGLTYLDSE